MQDQCKKTKFKKDEFYVWQNMTKKISFLDLRIFANKIKLAYGLKVTDKSEKLFTNLKTSQNWRNKRY